MFYKQDTYKYTSGGGYLSIPADAPSGWYEFRIATNLKSCGGLAGCMILDIIESGASTPGDIKYVPEYAPWYTTLAQGPGVYIGTPEVTALYLYASETSQANISEDVGFIGYAKHLKGMSEQIATLPQSVNPPAVPDMVMGSYILRQVTE